MSVTDELDALIEELDQAVSDELVADAPSGTAGGGEPDSTTQSSAVDALDLILPHYGHRGDSGLRPTRQSEFVFVERIVGSIILQGNLVIATDVQFPPNDVRST